MERAVSEELSAGLIQGKDLVGMFMIQQNSLVESEEPGYSVRNTFIAMTYAAIADDLKSTTNVRKAGTHPK